MLLRLKGKTINRYPSRDSGIGSKKALEDVAHSTKRLKVGGVAGATARHRNNMIDLNIIRPTTNTARFAPYVTSDGRRDFAAFTGSHIYTGSQPERSRKRVLSP